MKWIPVDKDNLYREEVLAINTSHDMLVGYLEDIEEDDGHVCCTDREPGSLELFHVTHYIPVTALVELVKEQDKEKPWTRELKIKPTQIDEKDNKSKR